MIFNPFLKQTLVLKVKKDLLMNLNKEDLLDEEPG